MMGSIKLIVASLLAAQLSGVIGSHDNRNSQKEQLRRNLRSASTTVKAQPDESQRDMQQMQGSHNAKMYDDYFGVPEEVEFAGNEAADDYFLNNRGSGMEYNWESAAGGNAQSNYFDDHFDDHYYDDHYYVEEVHYVESDDYYLNTKDTKGRNDHTYSDKVGKAGKVGKGDYYSGKGDYYSKGGDPYYSNKGGKGYYGGKAGKNMKGGGDDYYVRVDDYHYVEGDDYYYDGKAAKSSKAGTPYYQYGEVQQHVQQHDDYTGYDDAFHFTAVSGSTTGHGDDFFTPRSSNTRSQTGGNNPYSGSGNQGRSGMYYDDDFFHEDAVVVFLPRPTVTLGGSVFSVNPQNVMAPVIPDGGSNSLTLGTEYLYNEILTDSSNINSQLIPVDVDNQMVQFNIALDGYCTRIGAQDQNSVQGYCFFTYTFIDPATRVTSGAFTAQGIIVNAEVPGQLTVSGGTGIMTGATGLVEILPAALDETMNPPLLIQPPGGSDPFNGVAGWAHFFEFEVDVLFFLPELYAPSRPNGW